MQSTMTNEKMTVARPAPARTANLIDLLVERAKSDRKGVYWPVAPAFRQLPTAQLDATLGAGTAGIVLALAEFYRVTENATVRELIAKATAWLEGREQGRGFSPGFYFGSGGWWKMKAVLREVLPELANGGKEQAQLSLDKLVMDSATEGMAALTFGSGGSLIGVLSAWSDGKESDFAAWRPLVGRLVSHARLSPEGVYWDFYPHTVRAPGGFISGSAGIDYALAGLNRMAGCGYPELIASSVRHANAAYDARTANWPEHEGTEMFRRLGDAGITKIVQRARGGRAAEAQMVGDGLGWGAGVTGILLSRAAVADAFQEHPLAKTCLADCRRAVIRLERATDAELAGLDPYLQNGLAGIALAAKAYQATGAATQHPLPAGFEARLLARLEERSEAAVSDDLSLLTGAAGLAYALLKLDSSAPEDSCVNPLARAPVSPVPVAKGDEDLQVLFKRQLPRTTAVVARGNRLCAAGISLTMVERATGEYRTAHAMALEVKAANYELELYRQLAEITSFRHHLFREGYKKMRFSQSYGEGMNDTLLMERFRLDEDVSLLGLEFDPGDQAPELKAQPTRLIRQRGSNGIQDFKLSMLQQALLERFQTPSVVIEVIGDVIERVQTPNVTQRQLADLSLKMVRSFVAAGWLFPDTPGRIRSVLIQRRFRRVKMNLFPSELNR